MQDVPASSFSFALEGTIRGGAIEYEPCIGTANLEQAGGLTQGETLARSPANPLSDTVHHVLIPHPTRENSEAMH